MIIRKERISIFRRSRKGRWVGTSWIKSRR